MAIKKYAQDEGLQVFRGREAEVVNTHMKRHGRALSDFSKDEMDALQHDLESVRETEQDEKKSSKKAAKNAEKDGVDTHGD